MTRFASQNECRIACNVGQFAAGHIDLATGQEYWMIKDGMTVEQGAPVRSERFVYTQSGKKRTSRELCGRVFKKVGANRDAFVAEAVKMGVKLATARTMFSHYTVGRYAA
jgi:hypothetical protein